MHLTNLLDLRESLAISSPPIIVVTGATGWVGRTFLHELQKLIPADLFNSKVIAFASKERLIFSSAYDIEHQIKVPIYALADINAHISNKNIVLFHAAFLTKDRIHAYGEEDFVSINKLITETICNSVLVAKTVRIAAISSGAAAECEKREEDNLSSSLDVYGFLKLQEEMVLARMASTQVFRIYALSGRFIRDPGSFALGDFLLCALQNEQIRVRSSAPVIRGYANASDVVRCAISWIFSNDEGLPPIASVNEISTLQNLASLVSMIYGLQSPLVPELEGKPNSYSSSPVHFRSFCRTYGIHPMPMPDQILDTAIGVRPLVSKLW
ncbi:NAD-dependent epimerase/dehydratase family protein [Synechococcus sp. UW105]|uniref:NAD-dependent epimerase/dehydratase family protein n=1 Tax=Synechococcus sp. UW105 TaxID=337067 RepID=UPI000E0FB556|nr:NAD-dependent epimerase/dehydratase family protein [Synechococcus sp. UW105]